MERGFKWRARRWLARRGSVVADRLRDDSGVAGLIIAMTIAAVAATATMVVLQTRSGPTRDLEELRVAKAKEKFLEAGLMVYFNQRKDVPCPDSDQDGDQDACSGGATTSGTLPWATMGLSKSDAVDPYGTYYTYVVADGEREFCISVPNDYDTAAAPEFTGEAQDFDTLQVVPTTAGATGRYAPLALISHGPNRLGGISAAAGTAISDPPAGSNELTNATANPTTVYTGPYSAASATYFDDTVWAPVASDLANTCEQRTEGGELNADLMEDFAGSSGDVDQSKFDTATGGTEVQQANGQAVFSDATAYMTTVASNVLNAAERPLYISAEWTPDSGAATAGFSIVTRAEATPTAGVFDPGITFQFFSAGAAGSNTISIMNDGAQVSGFTSIDNTFNLTFGETYLLELYDNGDDVWMEITQKNLTSNRASAHASGVTGDSTGTRVALVNGANSISRLDTLVVGRPMMVFDTLGTGYAETTGNTNGSTTGYITVEGWFNPRTLPSGAATATLISQWDSSQLTRSSYRLFMSSGGALSLSLGDGTATTDTEALGVSLSAGTWTHVAVAYNDAPTHGEITVYINGSLANTITGSAGSPILAGLPLKTNLQEHFVVGANLNGTPAENIYDGRVSDVRVWSDVRTADEIADWYDHRLPVVDGADATLDGLVVNWRFEIEANGFAATQVSDLPSTLGNPGPLQGTYRWAGALLNTHRATSTDVCNTGHRVGAYRCDFRNGSTTTISISGANLVGLSSFYVKAWGGGGNRDTTGGTLPPYDGGGGGYAGGLFLNTGGNLTVRVGIANGSATTGSSFLDQDAQRVTGNRGVTANNANGSNGIGAVTGALVTSVIAPSATSANRRPGCVPAIAVVGDSCSDQHYTFTSAPVAQPGYGADRLAAVHATGQSGAVVMFWD